MDLNVAYPTETRADLLSRIGMHACFALASGVLGASLALGEGAGSKMLTLVQ